jgi:hypothetical protein
MTDHLMPSKLQQARIAPYAAVFLIGLWITTSAGLAVLQEVSLPMRAAMLALPTAMTIGVVLLHPAEGFALSAIGMTFMIGETGFQLDVGHVRTSALEVVGVLLLILLVWFRRRTREFEGYALHIPGWRFLAVFAVYATFWLLIGHVRGDALDPALVQSKGFLLYPCLALIMLAGVRNSRDLGVCIVVAAVIYAMIATQGIWQFVQGEQTAAPDVTFRSSGSYGPINVYGITLLSMTMLLLGLAMGSPQRPLRAVSLLTAVWLFIGANASVSRTVWVAFAAGLLWLLVANRRGRGVALAMILAALLVLAVMPESATARLSHLSDSSALKREFYLSTGWQAALQSWLVGSGWGQGFWYTPLSGLVPTGSVPWYHNDYLNLWVQVGATGLLLYLGFWGSLVVSAATWLRKNLDAPSRGFVLGGGAALVSLLVSAGFEHVLWRPDIAGVVSWTAGILLVGMRLEGPKLSVM